MPNFINRTRILCICLCLSLVLLNTTWAQWDVTERAEGDAKDIAFKKDEAGQKMDKPTSVEIQADKVGYAADTNKAEATGNVIVTAGTTTISADEAKLDRTTQNADVKGHVFLNSADFQVDADAGRFNFTQKTGTFDNARIFHHPFQLKGASVAKVSENHMVMEDGYMTTCDHDVPHWRLATRRMDVFPGDKAVARGVKVYMGPFPIMYLPKYTQDLKDKPWFTFVPGRKKDLGFFLLTRSVIKINPHWRMTLRVDGYERQGLGWGAENKYDVPGYGGGSLRGYFINERAIAAKHPWLTKLDPTVVNKRYQVEWRHKWDIDPRTQTIWQYYRLSDDVILKKYFEREYRREPDPQTYFLLTRALTYGTLSFRVDHRVNRFVTGIDRTPEVSYQLAGLELGDSGFYLKNSTSVSNLVRRAASPTEDRRKTFRVDTDNEISYPTRVGFVNVTPMVGEDLTYYSRTIDTAHPTDIVRTTFKTGTDFNTRFLKVFNFNRGFLGTKITRLRHIVAPGVTYLYRHKPSFGYNRLNQFDAAIDGLDKAHTIVYSLENKIQTKRGKELVELIRNLTTIDYTIKQKGVKSGLGYLRNLFEFTPATWFKFVSESAYNTDRNRMEEQNFDMYFRHKDKYGISIGDRYARGDEHQFVTQLAYVVNPKWKFKILERFNVRNGVLKEQQYALTRDLHEWEMDLIYNQTRGSGTSFLMSFTLKAFPGQPVDLFGTTFHQRKAGSQSSTND